MEDEGELTSAIAAVRRLVRGARVATLATVVEGQPQAALVTPACTGDLSVVLLLSELSRHTRQLRANGACALLVAAAMPLGLVNPQTIERVSLDCRAEPDDHPALRARFIALHPYAELYAGFGDFHVWRLSVERAHFVGGFARAKELDGAALRPEPVISATVAAAEAGVLAHCNADHADAMADIGQAFGGGRAAWRLVGVDPDGCDLLCGAGAARVAWTIPVRERADLRPAIVDLARRARQFCTKASDDPGTHEWVPVS